MSDIEPYKNLIDEIIAKQTVILGPDIVLMKARNVKGLSISDSGKTEKIDGNPDEVLQNLINEYVSLSGQIVKNIINPVLAKYPEINKNVRF